MGMRGSGCDSIGVLRLFGGGSRCMVVDVDFYEWLFAFSW